MRLKVYSKIGDLRVSQNSHYLNCTIQGTGLPFTDQRMYPSNQKGWEKTPQLRTANKPRKKCLINKNYTEITA